MAMLYFQTKGKTGLEKKEEKRITTEVKNQKVKGEVEKEAEISEKRIISSRLHVYGRKTRHSNRQTN